MNYCYRTMKNHALMIEEVPGLDTDPRIDDGVSVYHATWADARGHLLSVQEVQRQQAVSDAKYALRIIQQLQRMREPATTAPIARDGYTLSVFLPPSDARLHGVLYRAARELGWLCPELPEEVEAEERRNAHR